MVDKIKMGCDFFDGELTFTMGVSFCEECQRVCDCITRRQDTRMKKLHTISHTMS